MEPWQTYHRIVSFQIFICALFFRVFCLVQLFCINQWNWWSFFFLSPSDTHSAHCRIWGTLPRRREQQKKKKKRTIILYHEIIRTFWSTWSVWCERARVLTECENIYSTIESNCVRCSADAVRALFIVRILLMLVNCCLKTKHFWFDFCVVPKHHIMKLNVALKYFKLDRFFFSFFLFADAAVLELRNNEFDF